MQDEQQVNERSIIRKATRDQRIIALVILAVVSSLFVTLYLGASGVIDIGMLVGPCGFKQRFAVPCPTCGVTTSALAFVQGRIFEAFYIQPAGALLCCLGVVVWVLALLAGVFGVCFDLVNRFLAEVKVRYVILIILIVFGAAWTVTLARALAE